jgi:hypothetical protein
MAGPNMRAYLEGLKGQVLPTVVTQSPNTILDVDGASVVVATEDNPAGGRVSIALLQDVVDRVFAGEEVVFDPKRRSAFVGAVLRTMDGVEVLTEPRRARLATTAAPVVGPSGLPRWWAGEPAQRFWMEVTGRADVGTDLHAPQRDDAGHENWTYALVREVADGDVVFHYEKAKTAITSWSVATGGFWEEDTYWGTPRSTGPTGQPVQPYKRPGVWHGLHGPFRLPEPVILADLRDAEPQLRSLHARLEREHPGLSLYFPVQFRSDGIRAQQGYLVKFPREILALFPQLAGAAAGATMPPPVPDVVKGHELGMAYVPADEAATQPDRDPFPVDPAVVERGVRSHAVLQNALAAHVESQGFEPRKPEHDDPPWDVLWRDGNSEVWVAEVKSLTPSNEERQLRLGLGQLLRYRHRLAAHEGIAHAVLMVEHEPNDPSWRDLCHELGVLLVWPEVLSSVVVES